MVDFAPEEHGSSDGADAAPFRGGGVTGDLIRSIDWARTPLGPVSSWPTSLRTLVATILQSRQPMFLWWGSELVQFYNDAYIPSFGSGKHPAAMGQRGIDCWQEIWPIIGPQIDDVMTRGKASWNEDHLVPIFRNGRLEEVYWTYGYSPVPDDDGGNIAGTLVVCTETTSRVLSERRLQTIRRLTDATSVRESVRAVVDEAFRVVASASFDIPLAILYRSPRPNGEPQRAASAGVDEAALASIDEALAPHLRRRDTDTQPMMRRVSLPEGTTVASGPWPEPVTQIFVAETLTAGLGTFVLGVSSRLPFDGAYSRFLADFVDQVERAAARVDAFLARAAVEAERRNLLLQAPVAAALLVGPEHRFELANARYVRMVGREVVGKTYAEAFPEVVGTPLYEVIDRVYRSGEPFASEEYRVLLDRRGTGALEPAVFHFNVEPLRDGTGRAYGLIVIAVDITEQVSARHALERTNAEREKLVLELEAASRAKDAFLATVSHELRTPLNAILGWARVLRSGNLAPEKAERALEVIERNSLTQVQLIEDLLDVSRIISGKLRLDVEALPLAGVVEAAVESMQHALVAKDIRFHRTIDPNAASISGDAHRIQQVIWTLLSNAVKFTPKGGTVRLVVERVDSSVRLIVSDTGQGLSKDILPSIFERFKQADGSAARVHGGLGLGLAITRHIVELHGGTIEARSEGVGRGATFTVTLPVSPFRPSPAGPFRQQPAAVASPDLEYPTELQGLSVLVVDDDDDTRNLLTEVLQRLGASVLTAASAKEALAVLDRASPRVIVSDLGMPGMDGFDFIEAVRARPPARGGRTVALALTAYASPEDRRRAIRSGFHMHLAKPVEPTEFVAVLASLAQLALAMD